MTKNNVQLTDAEIIFIRQSLRDAVTYAEMELAKVEKLYPISSEILAHSEAKQRLYRAQNAQGILEDQIERILDDQDNETIFVFGDNS